MLDHPSFAVLFFLLNLIWKGIVVTRNNSVDELWRTQKTTHQKPIFHETWRFLSLKPAIFTKGTKKSQSQALTEMTIKCFWWLKTSGQLSLCIGLTYWKVWLPYFPSLLSNTILNMKSILCMVYFVTSRYMITYL